MLHTVPTDNSGFFRQILAKKTAIEPSRIVTRMARRTARITAGEEKEAKHQAGKRLCFQEGGGTSLIPSWMARQLVLCASLSRKRTFQPRVMDRRGHVHNEIPLPGEAVAVAQ